MHKYKRRWILASSLWYKKDKPLQPFLMDHKINNNFLSNTAHKFKESILVQIHVLIYLLRASNGSSSSLPTVFEQKPNLITIDVFIQSFHVYILHFFGMYQIFDNVHLSQTLNGPQVYLSKYILFLQLIGQMPQGNVKKRLFQKDVMQVEMYITLKQKG